MPLEPASASGALRNQSLGVRPVLPGAPCVRCGQPAVSECGYVDGSGQRCGVRLCVAHAVPGLACPRHKLVLDWLNAASATLRPHRPALQNRSASLLLALSVILESPLVALLRQHSASEPGVQACADGLAELRRAEELAWEFGWSAYTSAGHLDHVSIRVGDGEPPRVRLLVNQNEVFAEVPYWITRRRSGAAPDGRDHGMFVERLVAEATRAIGSAHAKIAWLPAS